MQPRWRYRDRMDRPAAVSLFRRFHHPQGSFYAGGQDTELRALLSEEITWHVPGASRLRVTTAVSKIFDYFGRRAMRAAGLAVRSGASTGPDRRPAAAAEGRALPEKGKTSPQDTSQGTRQKQDMESPHAAHCGPPVEMESLA
jgi:hypothetical protein